MPNTRFFGAKHTAFLVGGQDGRQQNAVICCGVHYGTREVVTMIIHVTSRSEQRKPCPAALSPSTRSSRQLLIIVLVVAERVLSTVALQLECTLRAGVGDGC